MNANVTGEGAAAADDDDVKKCLNVRQTRNQECLANLAKLTPSISHLLTLDMLNNFCFHIYAQNSLFISENAMVIF